MRMDMLHLGLYLFQLCSTKLCFKYHGTFEEYPTFSLLSLFWNHHAPCVSVNPPYQIWMPEPNLRVLECNYIMTPEHISTVYFINPSHESVCLYVYLLSLLGNGSVKTLPRRRMHTNKKIVGRVVFYEIRVATKESGLIILPRTSCYIVILPFTEGVRFLII
jgi:hypothetical protein